jgi:hypothetical protein
MIRPASTRHHRVKLTRNPRQALPHTVWVASPGEDYTEAARFAGGGDAYAWARERNEQLADSFGHSEFVNQGGRF